MVNCNLEKKLLGQIRQSSNRESSLLELIKFYGKEGVPKKATPYIVRLVSQSDDVEKNAYTCIQMGVDLERIKSYDNALLFYSCGLSLQPQSADIQYFLNNNMGYSLVMLERYKEAQGYCEDAITINPMRHNAFKNLGLSLQGQGKYVEAANNFMQAVRICSIDLDPRALNHLEDLLLHHPELMSELDGLDDFLSEYEPHRRNKLH
ncbi:MAG: tetratricopeptide repeat protein [Syntrophales bacterium]|jgi:tetratricopeptide (TPR) repeat protein